MGGLGEEKPMEVPQFITNIHETLSSLRTLFQTNNTYQTKKSEINDDSKCNKKTDLILENAIKMGDLPYILMHYKTLKLILFCFFCIFRN